MIPFKLWLERIEMEPETEDQLDKLAQKITTHTITLWKQPHKLPKETTDTITINGINYHLFVEVDSTTEEEFSIKGDTIPELRSIKLTIEINPELSPKIQKADKSRLREFKKQVKKDILNSLSHESSHILQSRTRTREYSPTHYSNLDGPLDNKHWAKDGDEIEAELQALKTAFHKQPLYKQKELTKKGLLHTIETLNLVDLIEIAEIKGKNYLLKTTNKMGLPFKNW